MLSSANELSHAALVVALLATGGCGSNATPADAGQSLPEASLRVDSSRPAPRDAGLTRAHDAGALVDALQAARDTGAPLDVASASDAVPTPDGGSPPCGVPFSKTGPWCYRLPPSTPVASNSAAVVANIQADITNNYGTFAINTNTFSSPLYTVPTGAPVTDWSFDDCQHKGSLPASFAPALQGVPTLLGMVSSMGTDHEISLYDPASDKDWEFWVATEADGGGAWSACWGGVIQSVSTNPGQFPAGLGATASGLPLLAYVIRIDELQSGLIQHAINVELVRTQATSYSWPANRTDGNTVDPDILMEGQRLRLDPTFDVSTLPNAAERTIAKALQDYGMILTDTSGAVVTQAEDDRPYMIAHNTTTSPYTAIFGGRASYAVLAELPIGKLQVLPKDYGQSFLH